MQKVTILAAVSVLLVSGAAWADQARYRLDVKGLACPFCAYGIEEELKEIDGVAKARTHVERGVVIVTMEAGAALKRSAAKKAVKDASFTFGGLKHVKAKE